MYPAADGPLSKLRISSHERSPGGQTATTLSGCAALGLRTSYIGTISSDGNGDFIRDALRPRGMADLPLTAEASPIAPADGF